MDNICLRQTAAFASNLKSVVGGGVVQRSNDAARGVDPFGLFRSPPFTNGGKRKWSILDESTNVKGQSSMILGFGHSLSSCTSISSGKETEEASLDLGLNVELQLGSSATFISGNVMSETSKEQEPRKLKLGLELSLSTGPTESDTTTVTQSSSAHQDTVLGSGKFVDEGSTSSEWNSGPLMPPLQIPGMNQPHSQFTVNPNILTMASVFQKVATTSGVEQKQQGNRSAKTCRFEGCTRGARGASGLCITHGGGRRCQRSGCQKGAEGKTVFCKAHGGGRRCQFLGCTKSAEGRTDYCIGHGGGRRCDHEGCTRAARGRSGLCIRHGGGRRCKMENCSKSAEGGTGLCISHGGGRRCQYPACKKGAQGSTIFCKAHGGGKRCTFLGCTKGAEGSTPFCKGHGGGKRCTHDGCTKSVHGGTLFCVGHGGGKRCAVSGCTKSARGRTDFCVRHGGGKRCKFTGCSKSAQGCTDFCKAHGGGKRCSWGQLGLEYGEKAAMACDKFARGKSGLCAAHSAQLLDQQRDGGVITPALQEQLHSTYKNSKGIAAATDSYGLLIMSTRATSFGLGQNGHVNGMVSAIDQMPGSVFLGNDSLAQLSLPEGRVHGGSLMEMLAAGGTAAGTSNCNQAAGFTFQTAETGLPILAAGCTAAGTSNSNQAAGFTFETAKSDPMPHKWV